MFMELLRDVLPNFRIQFLIYMVIYMKASYNFVLTKPHRDVLLSLNALIDISYGILLDLLEFYIDEATGLCTLEHIEAAIHFCCDTHA